MKTKGGENEIHRSSGLLRSALSAADLPSVPRPAPLDFHFERETQECPDGDDPGQYAYAPKCRVDRHGIDDVSCDQKLEAEENGAAELLPVLAIGRVEARRYPACQEARCSGGRTAQDQQDADELDQRRSGFFQSDEMHQSPSVHIGNLSPYRGKAGQKG
jgi:hypothetical protein